MFLTVVIHCICLLKPFCFVFYSDPEPGEEGRHIDGPLGLRVLQNLH